MTTTNIILDYVDLAVNFLIYDKREYENLPPLGLEESINKGLITKHEIVDRFRTKLYRELGEEKGLFLRQYVECPKCRIVFDDSEFKYVVLNKPAPCCGDTGKARILWPSIDARNLLESVSNQYLNNDEECRVAAVFLCSALELLLEDCLLILTRKHTNSQDLMECLLKAHEGKDRMFKLFNNLSSVKLGDLLVQNNRNSFCKDWDVLAKLRNKLCHGKPYRIGQSDKETINNVLRDCQSAFVDVHNTLISGK